MQKNHFKGYIFSFLALAALLVSALGASFVFAKGASSHIAPHASLSTGRSFLPSGHSTIVPHKVSTSTIPQVKGTGHGTVVYRPAPGGYAHVPSPEHVVPVPAPVNLNLTTKKSFEGQSENGWQPSDSNGAGGLNNYVETVNEQWAIYSRTGTQQYETDFDSWFGQPSGTSLFDPVVQWDRTGSRFLFIVDSGSSLLLSVAQQTNALGNYCNYTFPTPSGAFADFEKLGVDADGVYFSVNVYSNPFSNKLFFANRTQLESCQTVNYTYWSGLTNPDGSTAFAIVPARADSSSSGVEYLVNSYPGGACKLTLWKLTSSGSLSNRTVATQCYSPPPAAKQKGSSGLIDTGDNRLYQANFFKGKLTLDTVGSHDWGDGNGQVGIVEWFVLNASAGTVYSQGSFGTPGYWLFYPATIRNGAGNMLFVYNASGPSIDPSIWYVNQTLSGTLALASGASYYGTSGTSRWGDYESAWLDPNPNSPATVWITGQYAKGTNFWGTRVARVLP
jgi:hypothetical protein